MAECDGAMFWDLAYSQMDYTLNAQEEILDEKYEVRNNISQLDQAYFLTQRDGQNSFSVISHSPLSPSSANIDLNSSCYSNSPVYSPSEFADFLEVEGNFYNEKEFTELTPLKNESEDPLTSYILDQGLNAAPQIPGPGFDILPEASSNINISGDEGIFNFDIIGLGETEPIKMEMNYAHTPSELNSFENEFLPYTQVVNSPAELLQSSPNCVGFSSSPIHCDNKSLEFEEQDLILSQNNSRRSSSPKESRRSSLTQGGNKSWVREIKVGKNNRPRGPKCWEFVLRLLQDQTACPSLVKWEDLSVGSFRLVDKDKISAIWGNRPSKKKNGGPIKYESFARILRYHYKDGKGKVLPVSEKHLVYKFAPSVMEAFRTGNVS